MVRLCSLYILPIVLSFFIFLSLSVFSVPMDPRNEVASSMCPEFASRLLDES